MFVTIKYGNDESLLCNPSCAVVNLLNSIKRRTGYGNSDVTLDLSDEQGLVKELDMHHLDYASKYLSSHATYILVEKQVVFPDQDTAEDSPDGATIQSPPSYQYLPLLDNYLQLFPDYRLHVQSVDRKKLKHKNKSPSPAGVRGVKGKKGHQRVPSRKR